MLKRNSPQDSILQKQIRCVFILALAEHKHRICYTRIYFHLPQETIGCFSSLRHFKDVYMEYKQMNIYMYIYIYRGHWVCMCQMCQALFPCFFGRKGLNLPCAWTKLRMLPTPGRVSFTARFCTVCFEKHIDLVSSRFYS